MTYRFFIRKGAKPFIIDNANSESEARIMLERYLMEVGSDKTSQDFIMLEGGSQAEFASAENKRQQQNIKEKRDRIIAEEDEIKTPADFLKRTVKSALRITNPYSSERMEESGETSLGGILGDVANAVPLMSIPSAIAGKLSKGAMGALSGLEVINDIGQQESIYGDIDPKRTALNSFISFAPEIGGKAKDVMARAGVRTVESQILPSAVQQKYAPIQTEKMLEEGIFRGLGKFSGIEKLEKKLKPFYEQMQQAREGGAVVDIDKAYRVAVADVKSDNAIPALQKEKILANLENIFESEKRSVQKLVPEVKGLIPSKAHEYTMKELESIGKSKLTKASKQFETQIEIMRNAGMSEAKIAKMIGEAPIDPIKDVGLKQMKRPTIEDFYTFEDAKRQADEMFDPFDEVVLSPEYYSYQMPLGEALSKKTGMQDIGFKTTSDLPQSEAYRTASRAILQGIDDTDPATRQAMLDASPYIGMLKAMERRKGIGGSNSLMPLKDVIALANGGIGMYLLNKIPTTTLGGQLLYDAGKSAPLAGSILGYVPKTGIVENDQNP
jgi:hypothetical protein